MCQFQHIYLLRAAIVRPAAALQTLARFSAAWNILNPK